MTGPATSVIALAVASLALRPSLVMMRSTFSRTTIASSTTMPMASTRPNNVRRLIENPSARSTPKVPMIDTGTASIGMRVARKLCRKTKTTTKTSTIASTKVVMTSSIEAAMNLVVS